MAHLDLQTLTDEEVVKLILTKKDPKHFEIIYDRYSKVIFNKCLSFVQERKIAEDMSHDILLKVYLSLASFNYQSKFSTWLYSITYNACVDFKKKQSKVSAEYDKYIEEESNTNQLNEVIDEELQAIQVKRLKLLMLEIPNEERVALLLKYQDDLSVKDISQVTELSESAIKMRLKRGRDRLLKLYKDKYAHNVI